MSGAQMDVVPNTEPVWLFGYGSLIWKVNFPYQEKVVGYVCGFSRRFWQGSTDHRGTPKAPGRVVTLVQSKEDRTWGIAYKVKPQDVSETMAYLDKREIDGYKTHQVEFFPAIPNHQPTMKVLVYIATETNPSYLGPTEMGALAQQIVNSRGPSGCNVEYAMELAKGMRGIAPHVQDTHLCELEAKIKELLQKRKLDETDGKEKLCACSYCS